MGDIVPRSDEIEQNLLALERELEGELVRVRAALAGLQGRQLKMKVTSLPPVVPQPRMTLSPPPKSIVEAAKRALSERGPMHVRGLIDEIGRSAAGQGKTAKEIRRALAPALSKRKDVFEAKGEGIYGLRK